NRPHDASNLAKFATHTLERPFNWQVVRLSSGWEDWTDAPILTLTSHEPPKLEKADIDKIRSYVEAGGMLFTQADGDSASFNTFAGWLARELFGQELVSVPANHPVMTNQSLFNLKPTLPLKMVTNGSRILMLHAPTD